MSLIDSEYVIPIAIGLLWSIQTCGIGYILIFYILHECYIQSRIKLCGIRTTGVITGTSHEYRDDNDQTDEYFVHYKYQLRPPYVKPTSDGKIKISETYYNKCRNGETVEIIFDPHTMNSDFYYDGYSNLKNVCSKRDTLFFCFIIPFPITSIISAIYFSFNYDIISGIACIGFGLCVSLPVCTWLCWRKNTFFFSSKWKNSEHHIGISKHQSIQDIKDTFNKNANIHSNKNSMDDNDRNNNKHSMIEIVDGNQYQNVRHNSKSKSKSKSKSSHYHNNNKKESIHLVVNSRSMTTANSPNTRNKEQVELVINTDNNRNVIKPHNNEYKMRVSNSIKRNSNNDEDINEMKRVDTDSPISPDVRIPFKSPKMLQFQSKSNPKPSRKSKDKPTKRSKSNNKNNNDNHNYNHNENKRHNSHSRHSRHSQHSNHRNNNNKSNNYEDNKEDKYDENMRNKKKRKRKAKQYSNDDNLNSSNSKMDFGQKIRTKSDYYHDKKSSDLAMKKHKTDGGGGGGSSIYLRDDLDDGIYNDTNDEWKSDKELTYQQASDTQSESEQHDDDSQSGHDDDDDDDDIELDDIQNNDGYFTYHGTNTIQSKQIKSQKKSKTKGQNRQISDNNKRNKKSKHAQLSQYETANQSARSKHSKMKKHQSESSGLQNASSSSRSNKRRKRAKTTSNGIPKPLSKVYNYSDNAHDTRHHYENIANHNNINDNNDINTKQGIKSKGKKKLKTKKDKSKRNKVHHQSANMSTTKYSQNNEYMEYHKPQKNRHFTYQNSKGSPSSNVNNNPFIKNGMNGMRKPSLERPNVSPRSPDLIPRSPKRHRVRSKSPRPKSSRNKNGNIITNRKKYGHNIANTMDDEEEEEEEEEEDEEEYEEEEDEEELEGDYYESNNRKSNNRKSNNRKSNNRKHSDNRNGDGNINTNVLTQEVINGIGIDGHSEDIITSPKHGNHAKHRINETKQTVELTLTELTMKDTQTSTTEKEPEISPYIVDDGDESFSADTADLYDGTSVKYMRYQNGRREYNYDRYSSKRSSVIPKPKPKGKGKGKKKRKAKTPKKQRENVSPTYNDNDQHMRYQMQRRVVTPISMQYLTPNDQMNVLEDPNNNNHNNGNYNSKIISIDGSIMKRKNSKHKSDNQDDEENPVVKTASV